jgi:hypothetical protein
LVRYHTHTKLRNTIINLKALARFKSKNEAKSNPNALSEAHPIQPPKTPLGHTAILAGNLVPKIITVKNLERQFLQVRV